MTIIGTNFFSPVSIVTEVQSAAVDVVLFNGVCAPFAVLSPTAMRAVVPAGATSGNVIVVTAAGRATSGSVFTVTPAPPSSAAPPPPAPCLNLTSVSPASGPVGTAVTIKGTGFTSTTQVGFNGFGPASFQVVSDTTLIATVPCLATTGPIQVITNPSLPDARSVLVFNVTSPAPQAPPSPPPVITGISPASGPEGTTVTITGTNFSGASCVRFNAISARFTVISDTTISATVPPGAAARVATSSVMVTTPGGRTTTVGVGSPLCGSLAPPSFTVTGPNVPPSCPKITAISPTFGPVGTVVTISGVHLTGATQVALSCNFPTLPAPFTVVSDTIITATVPAGATPWPCGVGVTGMAPASDSPM